MTTARKTPPTTPKERPTRASPAKRRRGPRPAPAQPQMVPITTRGPWYDKNGGGQDKGKNPRTPWTVTVNHGPPITLDGKVVGRLNDYVRFPDTPEGRKDSKNKKAIVAAIKLQYGYK